MHPEPSSTPTDFERQAAVDRVQQALAEDIIQFEEVDGRFAAIYGATTRPELEAALAGLPVPVQPPPPAPARHLAPRSSFTLIGDVKIGGWMAFDPVIDATTLIGDVVIDLSSAAFPAGGITVSGRVLIGDVRVIVPDGARVQVEATALVGGRKERLTPPVANGPVVRVKMMSGVGECAVYSLSEVPVGPLRRLWAALRSSK
ncbi:MAG: DUF1707 domain-containing protein [Actinomycetia bacterium]|nr:DUF1707 domain-containing protein [Actinomycetes bacterium]MCP4225564.1 DUF1707 domain-containing protein [Actinomycetes bacterium]MCP5033145.1 DUF1707 domain-containing protein [Actinomycetes bacterium]